MEVTKHSRNLKSHSNISILPGSFPHTHSITTWCEEIEANFTIDLSKTEAKGYISASYLRHILWKKYALCVVICNFVVSGSSFPLLVCITERSPPWEWITSCFGNMVGCFKEHMTYENLVRPEIHLFFIGIFSFILVFRKLVGDV